MAQLTFPESMDALDVNDVSKSLNVLQNYISYICERTDFALRNMTKNVTAAGVSNVELYILVQALRSDFANLQSAVTDISSDVGRLKTEVEDTNSGLIKDVADINAQIGDTSTAGTIMYQLDDLDRRVTALENQP